MTQDQIVIFSILCATVGMFFWGRWRHDMIALASLLACVLAGLVPSADAFAGFGHPAVITVACVLVLSSSLQATGAVDVMVRRILPASSGFMVTLLSLTCLAAFLSAFMNNVGALALLMPVAVQVAAKHDIPPGRLLMPLAFGSILGGMTTLIGTPPNLIVASFSATNGMGGFTMFDFTPVGLAVTAGGIAFIALVGWRLVPVRARTGVEGFDTAAYLTEARIAEKSKAVGMRLNEIEEVLDEVDAQMLGLIRNEIRLPILRHFQKVRAGDILILEAEPEALSAALSRLDLKLEEDIRKTKEKADPEKEKAPEDSPEEGDAEKEKTAPGEMVLMELAVLPNSSLVGRSVSSINLRTHYNVNLLAVSRQGKRSLARLRAMQIRAGDVLLMQGAVERISDLTSDFGCVPLAERSVIIPDKHKAWLAIGIMALSVGGAAFGLVPASIGFAAGVLAAMAFQVVSPRKVYGLIDWPVIVLLGALIPVAGAVATTGAADLLARLLLDGVAQGNAVIALAIVLVVTMTLSDFMNNAATAAVMCPIALGVAQQLGVSGAPFLMAVAVGASCAFLTPIGHQNNTLILGPGGFRFGDYWRLGLPLEIIIVAISIPMLLWAWPL